MIFSLAGFLSFCCSVDVEKKEKDVFVDDGEENVDDGEEEKDCVVVVVVEQVNRPHKRRGEEEERSWLKDFIPQFCLKTKKRK